MKATKTNKKTPDYWYYYRYYIRLHLTLFCVPAQLVFLVYLSLLSSVFHKNYELLKSVKQFCLFSYVKFTYKKFLMFKLKTFKTEK